MDISLKRENYKFLNVLGDTTAEEMVEFDITLPEYMPEILRIIKTNVYPKILSCRISGERVTVDGVCEIRMIFTAEDGGLHTYSQSQQFTKYFESESYSESIDVTSKATVAFVNCRATSNRKAEIKTGISIRVKVFGENSQEILCPCEESGIEQKTVSSDAVGLGCRKTGRFALSDTIVPENSAYCIVNSSASAICTDVRKINNKLMVRGEAVVRICYVKESDKNKTDVIKHIIPINQIMEFEGMEERFTGNVSFDVCYVDVIPKGESSGSISSMDVSVGVDVCVSMWEQKSVSLINDAYGVDAVLDLKKSVFNFYNSISEISECFVVEDSFAEPSDGIEQIIDVMGDISGYKVKYENSTLKISGVVNVSVILKDKNGNYTNLVKSMDYCYCAELGGEYEKFLCEPEISLLSVECSRGVSGMDARAELNIVGIVFEKLEVEAVTDICKSEAPVLRKQNAITVYFPENEESLWSIARRYNTTVKAIAEENALEGETTENLKILFIPAL